MYLDWSSFCGQRLPMSSSSVNHFHYCRSVATTIFSYPLWQILQKWKSYGAPVNGYILHSVCPDGHFKVIREGFVSKTFSVAILTTVARTYCSGSNGVLCMMTSSNGHIFCVTGHLCGEFTGPGEFPAQRPVTWSFDVFVDLCLNKRLSKQS